MKSELFLLGRDAVRGEVISCGQRPKKAVSDTKSLFLPRPESDTDPEGASFLSSVRSSAPGECDKRGGSRGGTHATDQRSCRPPVCAVTISENDRELT